MNIVQQAIQNSIALKQQVLQMEEMQQGVLDASNYIIAALKNKGQVLFCGNGGSAADAQHLAAELTGRYLLNRPPLNAEALHVNTSYITAVANDFTYHDIYARLVAAKGKKGDVLVAISTSGNSKNVINAIEEANKLDMIVVGITGDGGGAMAGMCDVLLAVPSTDTPRVQEVHILLGHIICEIVEKEMYAETSSPTPSPEGEGA